MPDEVRFGTLHPDGTMTGARVISHASIALCPHTILVPEHYDEDGKCRCTDPEHREMAEWGYKWSEGRWR